MTKKIVELAVAAYEAIQQWRTIRKQRQLKKLEQSMRADLDKAIKAGEKIGVKIQQLEQNLKNFPGQISGQIEVKGKP